MQKLYGPQFSYPLARVVYGAPSSWDPSIATKKFPNDSAHSVWSPCSKFIASPGNDFSEIAILDAVTLGQLYTMHSQHKVAGWKCIVFSPDSCVLTGYSSYNNCIISWDLQTGGQISSIDAEIERDCNTGWDPQTGSRHSSIGMTKECKSIVYSRSGAIIGALFDSDTILTYDVLSGTQISSHSTQQSSIEVIWTHGEHLQFATIELGFIITWQVSLTSSHPPTKVSSLPTPDGLPKNFVLQPAISRLAFTLREKVLVWDTQNQKILLDSTSASRCTSMSFSSDGHFFVCTMRGKEFCIWKESLDGYLLHKKCISSIDYDTLVVSPNAEKVISFGGSILQLWQTANSSIPSPNASTQFPLTPKLLLEFSSDGLLVAYAIWPKNTVTVLDTSSGSPLLVINTGMMIYGMKITDGQIIVVGSGKVVTWNMPTMNSVLDIKRNTSDSIQTTRLEGIQSYDDLSASISSDLNYIALLDYYFEGYLRIHSMHTGKRLVATKSDSLMVGFAPGQNKLWCSRHQGEVELWAIVVESGSNAIKLKRVPGSTELPSSLPWNSPCGYQVTNDGWILSPTGMHLMWLPYHWRTDKRSEKFWGKNLLALHNKNFPEPLILRFED